MTYLRISASAVGVTVLLAAAAGVLPARALAQSDPHVGTWSLNVNKSKYSPGLPPRQQTSIYAVEGSGIKVTTKGVGMLGQPTSTDYTAAFDGKDYPVKGNADWDAVVLRRVDSHTIEFTRKKSGKVVQTATSVVSKDGKTRTITTTGVNAQGAKVNIVAVYERK
jgi:hypothetical protein